MTAPPTQRRSRIVVVAAWRPDLARVSLGIQRPTIMDCARGFMGILGRVSLRSARKEKPRLSLPRVRRWEIMLARQGRVRGS